VAVERKKRPKEIWLDKTLTVKRAGTFLNYFPSSFVSAARAVEEEKISSWKRWSPSEAMQREERKRKARSEEKTGRDEKNSRSSSVLRK
jgi:hypothetical protein